MKTTAIGISGRNGHAAAAIAVDGRLVAAVTSGMTTIPQEPATSGALVDACLSLADVDVDPKTRTITVDDSPDSAREACTADRMGAISADAALAAMAAPEAPWILVAGASPPSLDLYARSGERLQPAAAISGVRALFDAARLLAATLGLSGGDPLSALDRLSLGADPEFASDFSGMATWDRQKGLAVDPALLLAAVRRIAGARGDALGEAHSPNARVQEMRRALASSFVAAAARLVARCASEIASGDGSALLAVGGALFANPGLTTEFVRRVQARVVCAPVPEPAGRALGAALTASANGSAPPALETLALGPVFAEEDIKRTLENCRLDYVYEPDWPRLRTRVSRMLAQGRIVAWFQGPMTFGPRALGTRSILADPSQPYARQNVNQYLRGLPLDEPLPLVFASGQAARSLEGPTVGGAGSDVVVRPDARASLSGAMNRGLSARVHGAAHGCEPRLRELLDCHFAATAVPALIEVNLAGPGEPVACSPRDAVRTVYSSAIDALVIGRFLLMKDYWLLRSYGT